MAGYFFYVKPVFKKIQEDFFNKTIGFVRNASKKGGSSHVGKKNRGHPRHYGFKVHIDSFVRSSQLLYHQRILNYCPGLNVGIGPVARLYAKVPGRVIVSTEKTNFKPDLRITEESFPIYTPSYKLYINVIPEPLHQRFKLVEKF